MRKQALAGGLGEYFPVLLARRHGVNDHFVTALEHQHHRLQKPGLGVETEAQFATGWVISVQWFDP